MRWTAQPTLDVSYMIKWLQHWLEQEANYLPLPSPSLVTLLPPISLPSIGREEDEGGWKGGGTR